MALAGTGTQVIMINRLFNYTSRTNGTPAWQKLSVAQTLFTRLTDTYHFADVLRTLDRESQLTMNKRLGYHNTILTSMRPNFSHLHGLYFRLRLSIEDEYLVSTSQPPEPLCFLQCWAQTRVAVWLGALPGCWA